MQQKNVRTIPRMRLEGAIRPKTVPIVKRNYSPVTKFVNSQINKEISSANEPVITSVIPKFTPMFKAIIVPKQVVKDKTNAVKYKKGAFFELVR